MNYTVSQLRSNLLSEKVAQTTLYYSLVKKSQQSISILTNERLLIFVEDAKQLFYLQKQTKTPIGAIPLPTKSVAQIEKCKVKRLDNCLTVNEWEFEFESKQLADLWLKLIESHRSLHKESQIDRIANVVLNGSKMENNHADIVKEDNRDVVLDEGRAIDDSYLTKSRLLDGRDPIKPSPKRIAKPSKDLQRDWNYQFYLQRSANTISHFESFAKAQFNRLLTQDRLSKQMRIVENQLMGICLANAFSADAFKLRKQFHNYHFILQSTKNDQIVGVPLCCLLEYQGVIGLVKAKVRGRPVLFDQVKDRLRDLQRYTRIRNKILEKCKIYDSSAIYTNQLNPLYYVDELIEYLPYDPEQKCYFRPEYLLDHVNQLIIGGVIQQNYPAISAKTQTKLMKELTNQMESYVIKSSKSYCLKYFTHALEVKHYTHQLGISTKYLPRLYTHAPMKKALMTTMVVQIVKDYIMESIMKLKMENMSLSYLKVVEDILRVLMQGGNNTSKELWKQIAVIFKSTFGIPMAQNELLGGFFLNSLMRMIPGKYNIEKIDFDKVPFHSLAIIQQGFLQEMHPIVKSYCRFTSESIEKLKELAEGEIKNQVICDRIITELKLRQNGISQELLLNRNEEWIMQYLSLYYSPPQLSTVKTPLEHIPIYLSINAEPPSKHSLQITLSYLAWCIKMKKEKEFTSTFTANMAILQFWNEETHLFKSDALQTLSEYYQSINRPNEMVQAMRDSLAGVALFRDQSSQVGLKEYALGDKYLKNNQKMEAIQCFNKAKANLEQHRVISNKFGLIRMKMSSIYLSRSEYSLAEENCLLGLSNFQEYQRRVRSIGVYNEHAKVKLYEILSRIYEITDEKSKYKETALTCARMFNASQDDETFESMVKLSVGAAIFKSNVDRCESLIKLIKKIQIGQSSRDCLKALRKLGENYVVMEKFINRFEYFERSLHELSMKSYSQETSIFINLLQLVIGCVGEDYIAGLIEQKRSF